MVRYNYVLIVLLLIGCKKANERSCFKGTGEAITESRAFADVREIHLYDFVDYNLIQDSTDQVVIHCGANLINQISTETHAGILKIEDKNRCNWLRSLPVSITVDIHFTQLHKIRHEGSGTLRCEQPIKQELLYFENWHTVSKNYLDFEGGTLYFKLHAGGPYAELSGTTQQCFYYNSGRGKLRADGMVSNYVWADNQSEGDIYFSIGSGPLDYKIDGHGSIYYQGNPSEIRELSKLGPGELVEL